MPEAITDWSTSDPAAHAEPRQSKLAVWGVIAGLLMPIIGLVIAIVLFVRGQVGPGLGVCLASFLGFLGAILFL